MFKAIMALLRRRAPTVDGLPAADFERILTDAKREGVAPHCDSAILHAPGECVYCDRYPEWQAHRKAARIAFTGHPPRVGEVLCPSEVRRSFEALNRWGGNVPKAG